MLIFSKAENKEFSKPENHKQRNAVNAPSRRVMVFLFRRGTKVNPEKWPCPKAETEKVQECRDRFHSDGDKRLENRDKRRTFSQDHDTFACRFYELLATGSPCEEIQDNWVLRVLISGSGPLPGRKPLANEPYILTGVGPKRPEIRGKTDPNGVLRAAVEDDTCKMMLTIAGLKITLDGGALQAMDSGDPAVKERLCNLGYGDADVDSWTDDTYEKALKKFQKDHKLSETGTADADTFPQSATATLRKVFSWLFFARPVAAIQVGSRSDIKGLGLSPSRLAAAGSAVPRGGLARHAAAGQTPAQLGWRRKCPHGRPTSEPRPGPAAKLAAPGSDAAG